MTRTTSPNKRKATAMMKVAAEYAPRDGRTAAGLAIAYALLEVAFQIGRVADHVPIYGPEEER